MSIIDKRLEFCDAQALTATADSTNSIDLGSANDWIGPGEQMWLVIRLGTIAKGSAGNETYVVALETDDNSSFSSGTNIATVTIPRLTPAGTQYVVGIPYQNERYLQLQATLGGTAPAVTIDAYLTKEEPASWRSLPAVV